MEEFFRWSVAGNIVLILALPAGVLLSFFWGIGVGQRLGRGEPVTLFGGRVKGEVFQASEAEVGAFQARATMDKDPLAFLDDHINRSLRQKPLLDPDLAGQSPVQAGRGGE